MFDAVVNKLLIDTKRAVGKYSVAADKHHMGCSWWGKHLQHNHTGCTPDTVNQHNRDFADHIHSLDHKYLFGRIYFVEYRHIPQAEDIRLVEDYYCKRVFVAVVLGWMLF